MLLEYYLYYFYYTFLGFPFIIRVVVCAITLYIPFFICLLVVWFGSRKKFYHKKRKEKEINDKYGDGIVGILTSSTNYSYQDISNQLHVKASKLSKETKEILTNLILNKIGESISINRNNYYHLIVFLELREYWEKNLLKRDIATRQNTLRKLDHLDIEIPGSVITSLTYNRNPYLRKKARVSYLYFSNNDPYKFLSTGYDKQFNEWDKVEIHRILLRKQEERFPNMIQWIKNADCTKFKCFLINEIKYFNQKENCPFLLEIAKDMDSDIELRKHCIDAIGHLKYENAEDILLKDYILQPEVIQRSIVRAIQLINSGKKLSFLENAYHEARDVESRKNAICAIYNYGNEGKQLFESLKKKSQSHFQIIFDHVANPLIKYI